MNKNVGTLDKVIRILIAAVVVALYFTHVITGALGIILLVVAAVLVVTSLVSICPLWMMFGVNTRKKGTDKVI